MAQSDDRTLLVADESGIDSDVQVKTTGGSHRRRMVVGGIAGLGVASAVVLLATRHPLHGPPKGPTTPAPDAFKGDSLVGLALSTQVAAAAKWHIGTPGLSCSAVCSSQGMSCSAPAFSSMTDWQSVWNTAQTAGGACKMTWKNDNGYGHEGFANSPLICNAAFCGVDSQGTCTYDTAPRATCDGMPATGTYQPLPVPLVPVPSVPFPSPSATVKPSVTTVKPHTCKIDTGGSCMIQGCHASRGPTVCTSHKCECAKDHCASAEGVCH